MKSTGKGSVAVRRIIAAALCAALAAGVTALGLAATATSGFAAPTDAESVEREYLGGNEEEESGDEGEEEIDVQDEPEAPRPPVTISIVDYPKVMTTGERAFIKYELENADIGEKVKWESNNESIATVDSEGEVRALDVGKVEITASLGSARDSILITVEAEEIRPESFRVRVEEFTAEEAALVRHELKAGDELHISAAISPEDANLNGSFEWKASGDGVVSLEVVGDISESVVLKAVKEGDATLTVRYVDGNEDGEERVDLGEQKLVFGVTEEEEAFDFTLVVVLIIVAVLVALILILISLSRRRRIDEEERRRRESRKRGVDNATGRMRRDDRDALRAEGYERGFRDGEADRVDRLTRVYDVPGQPPGPEPEEYIRADEEPASGDGEPERPFSIDDIE